MATHRKRTATDDPAGTEPSAARLLYPRYLWNSQWQGVRRDRNRLVELALRFRPPRHGGSPHGFESPFPRRLVPQPLGDIDRLIARIEDSVPRPPTDGAGSVAGRRGAFVQDDASRELTRWIRSKGGFVSPKIALGRLDENYRGVFCTADLRRGEPLFHIPVELMICRKTRRRSPIGDRIAWLPDLYLSAFLLLYERRNPRSFWRAYLKTLPAAVPRVQLGGDGTDPALLAELEGTEYAEAVRRSWDYLSNDYALIVEWLKNEARIHDEETFSWEAFVWAVKTVVNHSYTRYLLVPGMDLINCHYLDVDSLLRYHLVALLGAKGNPLLFLRNIKDVAVLGGRSLYADSDYAAPSEVLWVYGKLDNLTSLIYYGFVQEPNPCESIPVRLALADGDDPAYETKMRFCRAKGLVTASGDYVNRIAPDDVPKSLTAFLRVATLRGDEELRRIAGVLSDDGVGLQNTRQAYAQLLACHEESLRGFPTSSEEDEALLGRGLPEELDGIVRARLSRKRTLSRAMHHLVRRIRELKA